MKLHQWDVKKFNLQGSVVFATILWWCYVWTNFRKCTFTLCLFSGVGCFVY